MISCRISSHNNTILISDLLSLTPGNYRDHQGSHSDGKTWKNGKAFSSQGILNRLEKSGKMTQNTIKLREFQTNVICYF